MRDTAKEILFVVARDQPALLDHVRRSFEDTPLMEVVVERRRGPRRRRDIAVPDERRRAERWRRDIDALLRNPGWAVVRVAAPGT